jgi:DNA-binding CsgD family transcriptional regulator
MNNRVGLLDFIGACEHAYDRTTDERAWLDELTAFVAPTFGTGAHATGYFFDLVGDDASLGHTAKAGDDAYTREDIVRSHAIGGTERRIRDVYECDMFTLLSRVVGKELATRTIRDAGTVGEDVLALRVNATHESGLIFTTPVDGAFRIRHRQLWTRFAAHVGAALRLRQSAAAGGPDSAVAILSPRGRLEDGTPGAVAARDDLARAAKDMDRARGKLRRIDPDEASALWRALVRGEWSLVEWFDHDGKRFLLAQANAVPVAGRKALTRREREVVACAAMGHSNKLIAYDLGLSTGTVAVLLTRAAKKLGVSGRVALIRAFRDGEDEANGKEADT